MNGRVVAAIIAFICLCSCSNSISPEMGAGDNLTGGNDKMTVFAAASLTEAFQAVDAAFQEAHPNADILFNFAGSQQLAQQLDGGAPGDVFASANLEQMEGAIAANRVARSAVQAFAENRLVVIVPAGNPAHVTSLQDLTRPGLRLVLAAEQVPVGRYTLAFLDNASADPTFGPDYRERVLANASSYELNVRAVLTKVALGEADAGIVYSSDLNGGGSSEILQIEIPDSLNIVALYYIAPIRDAENETLARDFIGYVLSGEGQSILERYGFMPHGEKTTE